MNPVETGFYYLQSRYYDPNVGRFINADEPRMVVLNSAICGAISTNLFTYCDNNPAMNSDPTGYSRIGFEKKDFSRPTKKVKTWYGYRYDFYLSSSGATKLTIAGSTYFAAVGIGISFVPIAGTALGAAFGAAALLFGSYISWLNADGSGYILGVQFTRFGLYLGISVRGK